MVITRSRQSFKYRVSVLGHMKSRSCSQTRPFRELLSPELASCSRDRQASIFIILWLIYRGLFRADTAVLKAPTRSGGTTADSAPYFLISPPWKGSSGCHSGGCKLVSRGSGFSITYMLAGSKCLSLHLETPFHFIHA